MALILKDRIKEGTTTTGTGDIVLGGAAATFDPFGSYMVNGDTTYYAVVHTSSGVDEWEVGIGTYNSSTNAIERTTILNGSSGTSAVDFSSGIKDVFMTYPAEKAVYINADSSVTLPDGLSVMGIIDGATSLEVETHIDLNTTDLTKPAHREGRIFYDEEYGALAVYNGESEVTLQVGQEEWILVHNGTGSAIPDGTPVYATGAVGEAISVAPADATTEIKARVIGLATHTIENGTQGYVTVRGLVSGLDTTGLTAGGSIHLSPTGGFQASAPTYPYYPTDLGYCIVVDGSNGYVYVNPVLHTYEQFRVTGNQHIDGNLTVDGNLTITGTQSIVSQANLAVDDSFIYLNSGDTIGSDNTSFSGTGLDDAILTGHYNGATVQTFYVRIDGVGTGTGGVDTFEWSLDNFSTTEATGVDIDTAGVTLADGISVTFNAATGHTSGDTWSGTASPVNVDSGTFANRNTGASGVGYTHMGWFFDVSQNKFVFLESYDPEPEGIIDLGDASATLATIQAGALEGDLTGDVTGNVTGNVSGNLTGNSAGTHTGPVVGNVTGDLTGNADTATALETARTIQLTGDVTGSVSFDGTANAVITATVVDDSHAHVISNVDGLQAALDAKADDSTTITAGTGLTGGGNIGVNRTLSLDTTYTDGRYANITGDTFTGDVTVPNLITAGNVDGRDVSVDGAKLDGIEAGATADAGQSQTVWDTGTDTSEKLISAAKLKAAVETHSPPMSAADIKSSYESNANTNAFTDALLTKLNGIETGATADQTKADIDALGIAAATLATARTIALSGDVSGSASFNGSANITITATVADDSHNHTIANVDGLQTALDGKLSTSGKAADSNLLDGIDSSAFVRNNNGAQSIAGNLTVGSGTASYIYMVDSDNGNRSIHNNSNQIGFLTQAGGWGSYCDDSGNWTAVGNVTAYSDSRLKENLEVIPGAVDKVKKLTGYTYNRIDMDTGRQVGLLAQDVLEVLPEAVMGSEDTQYSVAYGNMIGLLVEAIKEQQQQIEELKARLE